MISQDMHKYKNLKYVFYFANNYIVSKYFFYDNYISVKRYKKDKSFILETLEF